MYIRTMNNYNYTISIHKRRIESWLIYYAIIRSSLVFHFSQCGISFVRSA